MSYNIDQYVSLYRSDEARPGFICSFRCCHSFYRKSLQDIDYHITEYHATLRCQRKSCDQLRFANDYERELHYRVAHRTPGTMSLVTCPWRSCKYSDNVSDGGSRIKDHIQRNHFGIIRPNLELYPPPVTKNGQITTPVPPKPATTPSPPEKKRKVRESSIEDDDSQVSQTADSATLKPRASSASIHIVQKPVVAVVTNQSTQTSDILEIGKSLNQLVGTVKSLQCEVEKLREDGSKDRMLQKEESDRLWKLIFNLVEKNDRSVA
jgi:hypothetical protein